MDEKILKVEFGTYYNQQINQENLEPEQKLLFRFIYEVFKKLKEKENPKNADISVDTIESILNELKIDEIKRC